MADPRIVDHYKCQVVFQGVSGLAEDRYVNNLFFRNDSPGTPFGSVADNIRTAVEDFYNTAEAGQNPVRAYLTSRVLRRVELRIYDLNDAPPRQPEIREFQLGAADSSSDLPHEVASVLSFYAGRNLKRRRGRIFIGPLNITAQRQTNLGPRPVESFDEAMRRAAVRLRATPNILVTWVQVSQRDATAQPVTAGWVDDSFDTQRRRGTEPTSRLTW